MQRALQEPDYVADPQRKAAYSLSPVVASTTNIEDILKQPKSILDTTIINIGQIQNYFGATQI